MAMEAGAIAAIGVLAEESGRLYEQLGDDLGLARSRTVQGWAREGAGELDEARRLNEEAVALTRRAGDPLWLQVALNNLGNFYLGHSEYTEAAEVLEKALDLSPKIGFPGSRARVLENLGFARLGQVDLGGAKSCFLEALTLLEASGTTTRATDALLGLAAVAAARGQWERSARLIGVVDAALEATGRRLVGAERRVREATVAAVRRQLGDQTAVLCAEGRALEPDAAIAYALSRLD